MFPMSANIKFYAFGNFHLPRVFHIFSQACDGNLAATLKWWRRRTVNLDIEFEIWRHLGLGCKKKKSLVNPLNSNVNGFPLTELGRGTAEVLVSWLGHRTLLTIETKREREREGGWNIDKSPCQKSWHWPNVALANISTSWSQRRFKIFWLQKRCFGQACKQKKVSLWGLVMMSMDLFFEY